MKLTSIDQFVKLLSATHLLAADEIKALWTAIPAASRPKDPEGLAKLLVEAGRLNQFQAGEILAGRETPLVLGDYVLVGRIGAGGMGQVFLAEHRVMKRRVAVKLLPPSLTGDAAAIKRFQREVQAAARLSHPNIVAAHDAGSQGGLWYLVMEYVEGHDLAAVVRERGPLPVEEGVNYIVQAARGLAYAHAEGVIHRDIKPANLLVDKRGTVKILDMGLARLEGNDDGLTGTEQVMGTVDYMSPEQAANTKGVDARADVYSLGCTLWFLLTGNKAYDGDTMIARLMAHRDGPLPSLVKARDDVPWPLEQVFHKMIAKRPADRQQTMDEVVTALEPYAAAPGRSGPGSSIGKASSPELAAFLQSVGPAATPTKSAGLTARAAAAASPTAAPLDATAAFVAPEAGTDPKSEVLLKPAAAAPAAKPKPAAGGAKGTKPPVKLIAAGTGGLLLILLVVWIIIKKPDGSVTKIEAPEGGRVAVDTTTPGATADVPPSQNTTATSDPGSSGVPSTEDILRVLESPEYVWSEPENLGPNVNNAGEQMCPSLTADQLRLILVLYGGDNAIAECRRNSVNEPFGVAEIYRADAGHEDAPHLSGDGLFMAYDVHDPGAALTTADIRLRHRASRDAAWMPAEELPEINSAAEDRRPWISDDGLTLIFDSNRPGGMGSEDLYIARRTSLDVPFEAPRNLGKGINTSESEVEAQLLGDGTTLLFRRGNKRMYSYQSKGTGVTTAIELPAWPANCISPWLSPDGQTIYFNSVRKDGFGNDDLWVSRRVPRSSNPSADTSAVATATTASGVRPSVPTAAASSATDYALIFDNPGNNAQHWVEIPTLNWNLDEPLTIEGYFDVDDSKSQDSQHTAFQPNGHNIFVKWKQGVPEGVASESPDKNVYLRHSDARERVHVAMVVSAGRFHVFVNGKGKSAALPAGLRREDRFPVFTLGASTLRQSSNGFPGLIDEVRISKSARYQADFIPEARLAADADTLAIYHFDEGAGDVLVDSSGNDHHGKIVGARWVKADGSPITSRAE